jgi:hypothetical protein
MVYPTTLESQVQAAAIAMLAASTTFAQAVGVNLLTHADIAAAGPWTGTGLIERDPSVICANGDAAWKVTDHRPDLCWWGQATTTQAELARLLPAGYYTLSIPLRYGTRDFVVVEIEHSGGTISRGHFDVRSGGIYLPPGHNTEQIGWSDAGNGFVNCLLQVLTTGADAQMTIRVYPSCLATLDGVMDASLTGYAYIGSGAYLVAGAPTIPHPGDPQTIKGFIVDTLGGLSDTQFANAAGGQTTISDAIHCVGIVAVRPGSSERVALGQWAYSFPVTMRFMLRALTSDTPAVMLQRLRNLIGGVRHDLESQRGQVGKFYAFTTADGDLVIEDSVLEHGGWLEGELTLNVNPY